jgi:hypothetical protein
MPDILHARFYVPETKFVFSLAKEKAGDIHVHNVHTLRPFTVLLFKRRGQELLLHPHYHRMGATSHFYSLRVTEN